MKLRWIAFLLTFVIGGCATTPPRPNPSVVEREIVQSVLQELCAAVLNIRGLSTRGNPAALNESFASANGWMAAIETNLKTDLQGNASPSFTLLGPFLPAALIAKGGTSGSYNASVGGVFDQTASVLRDDKRIIVLDSLLKDRELCPPRGSPAFLAYYEQGAAYRSQGKYLAGTLGIRDWLYNGIAAQDFRSVAGPQTTVAERVSPSDIASERTNNLVVSQKLKADFFSGELKTDCPANSAIKITGPATRDVSQTQGVAFANHQEISPFTYCPGIDKLHYEVGVAFLPPPADGKPGWLTVTVPHDNQSFIFNSAPAPAPSAAGTPAVVKITATDPSNTKVKSTVLTYNIFVFPVPKATAFAPTYSATFTFIIKSTGQLGPAFTLDRAKGGSPTLFSLTRTETNYVNIALTAVGVPLEEINPDPAGQIRLSAPGYVDAVDKAIKRLDDSLLKLNISQIHLTP